MKGNIFGNNLKRCLTVFGYSQQNLGEKIGKTQRVISTWITGTCEPNLDTILQLCEIFCTSPSALLGHIKLNI